MRLKEIKPYMAIRCENVEQVYELNKQMKSNKCFEKILSFPCYILTDKNGFSGWLMACNIDFISSENYNPVPKIVNFSDLIIPELSAEEAVQWIVLHYEDGVYAEAFGVDCRIEFLLDDMSAEEVVSKIIQWKSDHEKKEPEIEWFWKSYVVGGSDYKEADTEQEAMEWCEYYAKEHPEAKCTYKHFCRVKEVK